MAGVVTGWAVEATISNLVATTYNFIAEHSGILDNWQRGTMEKELNKLQNQQLQIQSFLSLVEKDPITMDAMDPCLRAWLWQLRDAVDAANDLLDDFEYRRLEGQVNQEGVKVPSTSQSPTKYVKMMFKDKFGIDPLSKRLTEVVNQLNDVTSNINVIVQLALSMKLDAEKMHLEMVRSRVTGPVRTEGKFVGREKEREELKGWLLDSRLNSHSDDGIDHISLLTMVGLGGVGKTTLVQEVYNDAQVRGFFTKMIWVCVSNNFEPLQVLFKIMECGYGDNIISKENFSMIQETLQTKLMCEKFLIVLDDVWEDLHFDRWEKLVAPLQFGQMGSKILVTTRMNSVARMAQKVMEDAIYQQFDLKSLDYHEFLTLFNKYAFVGVEINNYKDLELLGQQFAKKLGGVPLLAKVVGGLLNSSLDHVHWKIILETDVMDSENGEKKVSEVLKLSYLKLPKHLQSCLRYCSLFPEDYKYTKDELVWMWMTVGLVRRPQSGIIRLEDVGEEYFNTLVGKSFFEEHPWGGYSMHDCLHQLARSLSREECFSVKNLDSIYVPPTVRHLALKVDDISVLQAISWPMNLRTLILELNENGQEVSSLLNDLLIRLNRLRVLKLHGRGVNEFPIAIADLLHLRYIYFESDHCIVVPDCFSKLYHMQVIQIFLPQIREAGLQTYILYKLIKLRYFMIAYDNHVLFPSSYPAFGKLTSLQKLDEYTVKDEDGYRLEELKDLNDLRYSLKIDGLEKVRNDKEGLNAYLKNKRFVNSLSFSWRSNNSIVEEKRRTTLDLDGNLLDCLLPHSELRELEIEGYNSLRPPYWLQTRFLWNLINVKFVGCERLVQLPPLGQLPSLKSLYLRGLSNLEKVGLELYGDDGCVIFPALEIIDMEALPKCTEWLGVENGNILFPCLSELYIFGCPQLRRIPALPLSLKIVELNNVGIFSLPPWLVRLNDAHGNSSSSSLLSLKIRACANLRTLAEGLLQAEEQFVYLENLKIWYCNELALLPTHGFTSLASLKSLYLMCPRISIVQSSMLENIFPCSLEKLHMFGYIEALFPKLHHLNSLSALELGHSRIKSLPTEEVFERLPALEDISIRHCNELVSLGGLHVATSLKELSMKGCNKIERVELNNGFISLEKLIIRDCVGLKILEVLHTLTSLKDLTISRCLKLSSINFVQFFVNNQESIILERCWIEYCGELSSLAFLHSMFAAGRLYINECQRLVTTDQMQLGFNPRVPLVNHLSISDPLFLRLEPIRSLNSIKTMHIRDCSQLKSLPELFLMQNKKSLRKLVLKELPFLESLPDSLIELSSLEELYLSSIMKVDALPLLPFSLKILDIRGCNHVLEHKYRRKIGVCWSNIDHIPSITIIPFSHCHR